jgi:hypothetical protein
MPTTVLSGQERPGQLGAQFLGVCRNPALVRGGMPKPKYREGWVQRHGMAVAAVLSRGLGGGKQGESARHEKPPAS